jgi:hypothetical protein
MSRGVLDIGGLVTRTRRSLVCHLTCSGPEYG